MQPGDDSQQEWTFTLYNFDNTDEVKKEVREGVFFGFAADIFQM